GLLLFVVGLLAGGLAPTMPVLVTARAIQGFGAGAVPAAGYVVIGRTFPEALRPRMFAILSTAWVVPGIVGPALAAFVGEHVGWRWVFLGLLPLVVIAGGLAYREVRKVPGHPGRVARRVVPDALAVAAGAALFLGGLQARDILVSPALVLFGLALGVPALRRLLPAGTLRARAGLPSAVLARGLLTFAFFGADVYVPLTVTSLRGESVLLSGIALGTGVGAVAVAIAVAGSGGAGGGVALADGLAGASAFAGIVIAGRLRALPARASVGVRAPVVLILGSNLWFLRDVDTAVAY